MAEIICPKCGKTAPEGSAFCTECGSPINAVRPELIVPQEQETPAESLQAQLSDEPEAPAVVTEEIDLPPVMAEEPEAPFVKPEEPEAPVLKQEEPEVIPVPPAASPAPPAPAASYIRQEMEVAEEADAYNPPETAETQRKADTPTGAGGTTLSMYDPPRPIPEAPVLSPEAAEKQRKANLPMSTFGTLLSIIGMSIPVIGLILMIVWACGGCRKIGRRNLARAYLILLIIAIVVTVVGALLLRFVFTDELTRLVEHILPGYTISWG